MIRAILSVLCLAVVGSAWASPGPEGSNCKADKDCVVGLSCDGVAQVCARPISVRLEEGCAEGEFSLCGELAKGYMNGEFTVNPAPSDSKAAGDMPVGIPKTHQLALTYFAKGCDGGDPYSCYQIGGMYVGLVGEPGVIPRDIRKTVRYWRRGCERGGTVGAEACFALAMAYQKGSFGVPRTPSKADKYFRKGCPAGNQDACSTLELPVKPNHR